MKLIKPKTVTSSMITSTTATETVAAFSVATTYALGDLALYNERIYKSLLPDNVGNQPDITPAKWQNIAPSNKMAMFDSQVSTSSNAAGNLTCTFTPGSFNSLAFIGLVGSSLTVDVYNTAVSPKELIYTNSVLLEGSASFITDWYAYFFDEFDQKSEVVLYNIPLYGSTEVTINIVSAGVSSLASLVLGNLTSLGTTQYSPTISIIDFSKKETDEFGNTNFVKRVFSKRTSMTFFLPNTDLRKVVKTLSDVRAVPCVYIGSDIAEFDSLIVYGFYRDFNIDIAYPSHSLCSIEIEGLSQT